MGAARIKSAAARTLGKVTAAVYAPRRTNVSRQ
jgi:hypothetical protein